MWTYVKRRWEELARNESSVRDKTEKCKTRHGTLPPRITSTAEEHGYLTDFQRKPTNELLPHQQPLLCPTTSDCRVVAATQYTVAKCRWPQSIRKNNHLNSLLSSMKGDRVTAGCHCQQFWWLHVTAVTTTEMSAFSWHSQHWKAFVPASLLIIYVCGGVNIFNCIHKDIIKHLWNFTQFDTLSFYSNHMLILAFL